MEANYKNNGPNPRLHLFQASIYDMPFAPATFDKVVCLGVLQHTPDFEKSVKCLVEMVKPGGELVVDFYSIKGFWTKIHSKYFLRPFTKSMNHEKLSGIIDRNAGRLIAAYRFFASIGLGAFNRFLPVCDIDGTLPKNLGKEKLREMVVLDTFDNVARSMTNHKKLKLWLNGLKNMVWRRYGVELSGGQIYKPCCAGYQGLISIFYYTDS